jgi:hypothetical protein
MKQLLFILIIVSGSYLLAGQTDNVSTKADQNCSSIIKEADNSFQSGQYDKCISLLNDVLKKCKITRNEKEHVLELLANAYLETGDRENADVTVNILLANFPHYEIKESTASESFIRLIKKYNIHPLLTIGARNTANWHSFKSLKTFSVLDGLNYDAKYNGPTKYGFFYYGWIEVEFDKGLSLNTDETIFYTFYNRTITKQPGFSLYFSENLTIREIPLYIKKYFPVGRNTLSYATAGLGWFYMKSASGYASINYTKDDVVTGKNVDFSASYSNINLLEMRNRNTFEWLAGVGIGYKIKNLRMFLDARYFGGLNSLSNAGKRLQNTTLVNDYFYVDNSFKLNQFELGASISYTLINSVKRIRK